MGSNFLRPCKISHEVAALLLSLIRDRRVNKSKILLKSWLFQISTSISGAQVSSYDQSFQIYFNEETCRVVFNFSLNLKNKIIAHLPNELGN